MAMKLEKVVPFGRTFAEYVAMFNLKQTDLTGKILGVGDGPASFNAEGTELGYKITSIDPIYQFSKEEITRRFNAVVDDIINQIKATPDDWVWSYHQSPEDLRNNRIKTIELFSQDYELGKQQGRYLTERLPKLRFKDCQFDLALCSHFLFLYSDHYDLEFHYRSIQEMLRVSREVRIFPLLTLMLQKSPYLDRIIARLQTEGYIVSIEKIAYELQKGGDRMLRIKRVLAFP
jgi:SAM-dependent methyltransferase